MIDHHYPPHHASNASQYPGSRIPSSRIPAAAATRPSRIAQSTQQSIQQSTQQSTQQSIQQSTQQSTQQSIQQSTQQSTQQRELTSKPPEETLIPTGVAVRPYEAGKEPKASTTSATSENDESTAQMTASFHSRTKSLPRTKRREDGSPGPANVAVVSPMPSAKNEANEATSEAVEATGQPMGSIPAGLVATDCPFFKYLYIYLLNN